MRLLFVTARFPFPLLKGDQLRAYQLMRSLSAACTIDILSFSHKPLDSDALHEVSKYCNRIMVFKPSLLKGIAYGLEAIFRGLPFQNALFQSSNFGSELKRWLAEESYDGIYVQLIRMAPYIIDLKEKKIVLDLIDSLGLNTYSRAEKTNKLSRIFWREEARRCLNFEKWLSQRFSVTVVAETDKYYIGVDSIKVVPIGVNTSTIPYSSLPRRSSQLLYFGNMEYFANIDAATHLINDVFPHVKRVFPGASVVIAGASPSKEILDLADTDIEVTGRVETMLPYLHESAIGVFPLRVGSGMQFKILESMAAGLPVVTTPFAQRGIPNLVHGEHALIGETPTELSNCIYSLLQNPDYARLLAANARKLIEDSYSWEASANKMLDVFK